jgi:hypothetical protein
MIANKFTQAINATYGSNLKAVDLGNYRILFQNHFNLFIKQKPSRRQVVFAFSIPDQHRFVFLKALIFPVLYKNY